MRSDDEWFWDVAATRPMLRLIPSWGRPAAFAVVLALLSWPLVAASLDVADLSGGQGSLLGLLAASASAVLPSAAIAGWAGGQMVQRAPLRGCVATFVLALVVAIATLPVLPGLLGQDVGVGCVNVLVNGGPCPNYPVRSSQPLSGIEADPFFMLAPLIEPIPVLILAVGVGIWAFGVLRLPEE
jgi:hypothetical protein